MHEDENLMLARILDHLFVADLVHDLESLEGFLDFNADVKLGQGHGTVRIVKVEQIGPLHPQKAGHVSVVGQGGTQTNQSDHFMGRLDLSNGPGNDTLDHWPPIVV